MVGVFWGGRGGIKITFFKYCLSIYQVPKKSVCSRQCKLTRFQGVSHSIGTIFKLSLLLPIIRLACLYLKTPIIKLERYSRNTSNLRYSVGTTRVDSHNRIFCLLDKVKGGNSLNLCKNPLPTHALLYKIVQKFIIVQNCKS